MGMSISIKFLPENRLVKASQDDTILEAALKVGLKISHSCGGNGTCGTCRVWVREGLQSLPPRNEIEEEMAKERDFKVDERLSCQNQACRGLVIELC
jgi:2Fe-2S ferredoxin